MRGGGGRCGVGGPFRGGGAWPPVPRLWPGETCAICASGPSLTLEQVEAVRGRARVVVVNTTYRLAPWADLLYGCDRKWWEKERPEFSGLKVSQDPVEGVLKVPSEDAPGLSLDPVRIHQGANSGYQALNLAVLLGAARVVLLGYDMRVVGGERHWHGDHPPGLNNPDASNFARWASEFARAVPDLARAGVEVINCTQGSALRCFPMADLEDAL